MMTGSRRVDGFAPVRSANEAPSVGPNPTLEATSKRRRWAALAVLCVTLLLISLDNTVLNVALPTIVRSLGANSTQLQWMVDAYAVVFAGLLLSLSEGRATTEYRQATTANTITTNVPPMPVFVAANFDQVGHRREGFNAARWRPSMWRTSTMTVIAVAVVTVIAFLGISLAHVNNQN